MLWFDTGITEEYIKNYGKFIKYNTGFQRKARQAFEKQMAKDGKFKDDTGRGKYTP